MAVDEFGREIPGHRGGGDRDGSKEYYGPSSPRHPEDDRGGGMDTFKDHNRDRERRSPSPPPSSSSSRYPHHPRQQQQQQQPQAPRSGGRRNHREDREREDRYYGGSSSSAHHHQGHHGHGHHHHPQGYHHHGTGSRRHHGNSIRRPNDYDNHNNNNSRHHHHGRHHSSHHRSSSSSRGAAAAERYASKPMLCQYLWKQQQQKEEGDDDNKDNDKDNDTQINETMETDATTTTTNADIKEKQQETNDDPNQNPDEGDVKNDTAPSSSTSKDTTPNDDDKDDNNHAESNNDNNNNTETTALVVSSASTSSSSSSYDNYRHAYCLNYVRSFFNHHLDDSWFRRRYSPLGRKRCAMEERERASQEAQCLQNEIKASLESYQSAVASSKDKSCGFVRRARLGNGHKDTTSTTTTTTTSNNHHIPAPRKRKYSEGGGGGGSGDLLGALPLSNPQNVIPQSHLFGKMDCLVTVQDIPPYVTDEQLGHALMDHCDVPVTGVGVQIYSAQVEDQSPSQQHSLLRYGQHHHHHHHHHHAHNNFLDRDAFLFVESPDIKKNILTNLTTNNAEKQRGSSSSAAKQQQQHDNNNNDNATSHVPRKEDVIRIPRKLDLIVECSDPYGRFEIDADGKGGAPPDSDDEEEDDDDNNNNENDKDNKKSKTPPKIVLSRSTKSVAHRKCTVTVVTEPPEQKITVLSASVSSKSRIPQDKEAAMTIARALDVAHGVPRGVRLDDLLDTLFSTTNGGGEEENVMEDMLDVSIAYLRRVHLFSFYQGCTKALGGIGEVLSGKHASATIHLRLANADELLQKAKEEADEMYGDLVVKEKEKTANDDANAEHNDDGEDTTMKEEVEKNSNGTAKDPIDNKESSESTTTHQQQQEQQPSTDLLVRRLDESIAKATSEGREWVARAGMYVIDQEIDTQASDIENKENSIKRTWIDNHGSVDMDGRARCTFHFCRKLFKDETFLKKHLMKKHGEFLRAEIAKVHDTYMMKAWDLEIHRPVPPIMVDCGTNFGLVPSVVIGADQPTAMDPEPDLWAKEEEQRKRRTEQQQHNSNDDRYNNNNNNTSRDHRRSFDGGHEDGAPTTPMDGGGRNSNRGGGKEFVDVDDVQVEKVEMKFEDVVMIPPVESAKKSSTKKKKKKKRKLL